MMSQDLHINLIKEIRKYPVLYERANLSSEKETRAKIWQEISDKLHINAKSKWNYLRDQYTKRRKTNVTDWYLFEHLDFLEDRKPSKVKLESRIQNAEEEEGDFDEFEYTIAEGIKNEVSTDCDSETAKRLAIKDLEEIYVSSDGYLPSYLEQEPDLEPCATQPPKKRKKHMDDMSMSKTLLETLNEINHKLNTYITDDDNEDWHFLQSIRYKMKKMSNKAKTKYKVKMLMAADLAKE